MKCFVPAAKVFVTILAICCLCVQHGSALTVAVPELAFREVKIKGDDFAVLQAAVNLEMSDYWIGYDSSDVASFPQPEYQLSSGKLVAGEAALLVSGDSVPTCDAVYAMDMPVALAETKGIVALWKKLPYEPATKTQPYALVDSFTWINTKTGVADIVRPAGTDDSITALQVWFRDLGAGKLTWSVGNLRDTESGCVLEVKGVPVQTLPVPQPSEPPVVVQDPTTPEETTTPITNEGLTAPYITELLPNPTGTGTDATDEFIELYNPNAATYDISGYVLESGVTTKHSYIFPTGTILAPQSFTSFGVATTGLTLSNSSGQATLYSDNDGEVLSETESYGSAPDGQSWVLADGEWSWTTTPTPGNANALTQPVAITTAAKVLTATSTAKKTTTTAKAATTTAKATKAATTKAATTKASTTAASKTTDRPLRGLHPLVLAVVAAAAVGYGLYEYRHDVANAFYKFRSNRATRRSHRG